MKNHTKPYKNHIESYNKSANAPKSGLGAIPLSGFSGLSEIPSCLGKNETCSLGGGLLKLVLNHNWSPGYEDSYSVVKKIKDIIKNVQK